MTNEAVTQYIDNIKLPWQIPVCTQIRELILKTIPGVDERIQYGKPHYRKNNKYACVLGTAKGWVSFTIFNAEKITPPEGLFESSDTGDRKTIKILEGQSVDYDMLAKLLGEASSTL